MDYHGDPDGNLERMKGGFPFRSALLYILT